VGFGDQSTGRGTFGGEFEARHCNQWGLYGVCVCYSAATRPSSQITVGRLAISRLVGVNSVVLGCIVAEWRLRWSSSGEFQFEPRWRSTLNYYYYLWIILPG